MFGKIGKQKKSTAKDGISGGDKANSGPVDLVTYITISDIEGDPSAKLTTKVTIGSEVGEFLVEHDSISPRHCTFYLNQDVISIMDHSSEAGTYINKKKIAPGKMFILGDKDKIKIGDFKVLVHDVEEPIMEEVLATEATTELKMDSTAELDIESSSEDLVEDVPESIDEVEEDLLEVDEEEFDVEEVELDDSILSDDVFEKHNPSKKTKKVKNTTRVIKDKKNIKTNTNVTQVPSAGMITRIFATIFDLAICFIILEIFLVFIDFANLYKEIPSWIYDSIKPLYDEFVYPYYLQMIELVPQIGKLTTDLLQFEYLEKTLNFICFFFALRILSGLIFSRSLGQAFVGIHFEGRFITKRLIYPLRELFGFFLFPFLLFDLPSLISKRTFKEVITFTRYLRPTNMRIFLSVLIMTPVFTITYCFAPAVKGLSIAHFVPVSDGIANVRKYEYKNKMKSSALGIYFDAKENLKTLPDFSISMKNKKRILNSGVLFIDLKNGSSIKINKIKDFKILGIYNDFVKLNPLSKYFQPKMFALVNDVALKNKNFKFELKEKAELIEETKGVISSSFAFDFLTIHEFIIKNGVIYSGFRDFREKMESLYTEKVNKINFVNFGNIPVTMTEHNSGTDGSKYYRFFTLGELESVMFTSVNDLTSKSSVRLTRSFKRIDFDDNKTFDDDASSFIQYINNDEAKLNRKLNQNIYKNYYDVSTKLLQDSRFVNLEKVMKNIDVLLDVLEEKGKLKNKKLYQNMSELIEAIKSQDYRFFGIRKNKTV
jgi:pSer/pThr/pTyr-binding forkhead associated (FHA) protein